MMKYEIPDDIKLEDIPIFVKTVLRSYADNEVTLHEILNHADDLEELVEDEFGILKIDEDDHISIMKGVLWFMHDLDLGRGLIMLPSDVPYFLEFLDTPEGQALEGWRKIREYIAGLKVENRIEEEETLGFHRQRSVGNNSL